MTAVAHEHRSPTERDLPAPTDDDLQRVRRTLEGVLGVPATEGNAVDTSELFGKRPEADEAHAADEVDEGDEPEAADEAESSDEPPADEPHADAVTGNAAE